MRQAGLPVMDPERATESLGRAVAHSAACHDPAADGARPDAAALVVADVVWDRFVDSFTATRTSTLFDDVPEAAAALAARPAGTGGTEAPSLTPSWPLCRARMPSGPCWTSYARRRRRCSGTAARPRCRGTARSRGSGSTRSPRSSSATGWVPRPD